MRNKIQTIQIQTRAACRVPAINNNIKDRIKKMKREGGGWGGDLDAG